MTRRGLTITEAIIAIFILAAGFIITARCFNNALQYSATTTTRQEAVICAQNRLRAMRAWSRTHHFPRGTSTMDDWGPYAAGGPVADVADPRYQITTTITQPEYYNPCTRFESLEIAANTDYKITQMRRQITVTASWGSGANRQVVLTTMICAPPPIHATTTPHTLANGYSSRGLVGKLAQMMLASVLCAPEQVALDLPVGCPPPSVPAVATPGSVTAMIVTVTPSVTALHHDEMTTIDATTRLKNSGGFLPGQLPTRMEWSLIGPGNGTLKVSRDGRRATLTHRVTVPSSGAPRIYYTDGLQCTVEVTAKYAGRTVRQTSVPISLVP